MVVKEDHWCSVGAIEAQWSSLRLCGGYLDSVGVIGAQWESFEGRAQSIFTYCEQTHDIKQISFFKESFTDDYS